MTSQDRFDKFALMKSMLVSYAKLMGIPIRDGQAHRSYEEAVRLWREGKGIYYSKHRKSLAKDYWITTRQGNGITWKDPRYADLGIFWEFIGGTWGGNWKKKDVFHFEWRGKI